MVKRVKLLAAAFSLSFIGLQAQTPYYYYYKGEKQYLSLHTEYAFLSLKESSLSDSIRATALRSDESDRKHYRGEKRTARFYTEFANQTKNISPFPSSISNKSVIFASTFNKVALCYALVVEIRNFNSTRISKYSQECGFALSRVGFPNTWTT